MTQYKYPRYFLFHIKKYYEDVGVCLCRCELNCARLNTFPSHAKQ